MLITLGGYLMGLTIHNRALNSFGIKWFFFFGITRQSPTIFTFSNWVNFKEYNSYEVLSDENNHFPLSVYVQSLSLQNLFTFLWCLSFIFFLWLPVSPDILRQAGNLNKPNLTEFASKSQRDWDGQKYRFFWNSSHLTFSILLAVHNFFFFW